MAQSTTTTNLIQSSQGLKTSGKLGDITVLASPHGVTRERSFIRTNHHSHQQNSNKRRSLVFNHQLQQQQSQQIRGKPALEIYRPPSKYYVVWYVKQHNIDQ